MPVSAVKFAAFLLLLPLFAQGADLCRGRQMRVNPAPSTEPYSQSFLWKVSKPGQVQAPSYLLGTFHSDGGRILENWEGLAVLFDQMKSFVAETSFAQSDNLAFGRLTLNAEPKLAGLLGPDFFAQAREVLLSYQLTDDTIARLKPWAAFLQMAQPTHKAQSLDAFLYTQSLKVPLDQLPLQNPEEMTASAEKITQTDQLEILKDTICDRPSMMEQVDKLGILYTNDDVAGFLAENEHWLSSRPGLSERLTRALVTDRNQLFLPKLSSTLAKGGAFVAVGAGHLFGEDGLLLALKGQGYELVPVERAPFMAKLFAQANERANGLTGELLTWLKKQNLVPGKIPPRILFVPTAELEQRACGGPCNVSLLLQGETVYASVELYQELNRNSIRASTAVLEQMIRATQAAELAAKGENHCSVWVQKNVENIILQGRFLSEQGAAAAGLDAPEIPLTCIP